MIRDDIQGHHAPLALRNKILRPHPEIEEPYQIWCTLASELDASGIDPYWAQEYVVRMPLHIISPIEYAPEFKNQIMFIGGFRSAELIYNRKVEVCRAIDYKKNHPKSIKLFGWGELFISLMMMPEKQRDLATIIELILADIPTEVSLAYFGTEKLTRQLIANKLTVSPDRLRMRNRTSGHSNGL